MSDQNNQLTIPTDAFSGASILSAVGPHSITAISADTIMRATSWVFRGGVGVEPVLTITADGELIFRDATEAAQALLAEWNRITGRG
jgi:hypothetical protein